MSSHSLPADRPAGRSRAPPPPSSLRPVAGREVGEIRVCCWLQRRRRTGQTHRPPSAVLVTPAAASNVGFRRYPVRPCLLLHARGRRDVGLQRRCARVMRPLSRRIGLHPSCPVWGASPYDRNIPAFAKYMVCGASRPAVVLDKEHSNSHHDSTKYKSSMQICPMLLS